MYTRVIRKSLKQQVKFEHALKDGQDPDKCRGRNYSKQKELHGQRSKSGTYKRH